MVTLVAEEIDGMAGEMSGRLEVIDGMAGEMSGRLEVIDAELGDVRKRLEKLYEAIETSELTPRSLSEDSFLETKTAT